MPHEIHPTFNSPKEPDTQIWRYMSFTKLLALLNDEALFFARADKLAEMDPFEGRYTHANVAVLDAKWEMAPPEFWAEKNFQSEDELKRFIDAKKSFLGGPSASAMREIQIINC